MRVKELKALALRLLMVYFFYFLAKVLFTIYNYQLLGAPSIEEFFRLYYHGILFDTSAIFYVNSLFVLLSILPFKINTSLSYQRMLFYVYFVFNLIAYATNFIDFIYFKYTLSRSTLAALESVTNEGNKLLLFFNFLGNYWHVFLLFFVLSYLWIKLYKKTKIPIEKPVKLKQYYWISAFYFLLVCIFLVGGMRGSDFKMSTRPITVVDANRHVKNRIHAAIVLNTPFTILRTFNKRSINKVNYMPQDSATSLALPIKRYNSNRKNDGKRNVVIFILESFSKEYIGAFNKNEKIENYQSYTPFLDSLAQHSLIFSNAQSNGFKSIHSMSSILSGIPSFIDAFTSTSYSNQKIESLVSVLKNEGYNTSFFHGAENGSMGYLGYSNILGIDKYYGRNEYNNDDDFDGTWGIWDEPFLQYTLSELSRETEPFLSAIITLSSHEPYKIPEKYEGRFPEGQNVMHKCIGYSDYALKRFFEEAKKEPWFQNTIFAMTADHTNLIHYPEYRKELNWNAVPILFYTPNEDFVGEVTQTAQQIDIYPTILDMLGYEEPFRSWGRSLIANTEEPFAIKCINGLYYYYSDEYVYCFDGKNTTGFYKSSDKALQNNLMEENLDEMFEMEKRCKAFIQDYMYRITEFKLTSKSLSEENNSNLRNPN